MTAKQSDVTDLPAELPVVVSDSEDEDSTSSVSSSSLKENVLLFCEEIKKNAESDWCQVAASFLGLSVPNPVDHGGKVVVVPDGGSWEDRQDKNQKAHDTNRRKAIEQVSESEAQEEDSSSSSSDGVTICSFQTGGRKKPAAIDTDPRVSLVGTTIDLLPDTPSEWDTFSKNKNKSKTFFQVRGKCVVVNLDRCKAGDCEQFLDTLASLDDLIEELQIYRMQTPRVVRTNGELNNLYSIIESLTELKVVRIYQCPDYDYDGTLQAITNNPHIEQVQIQVAPEQPQIRARRQSPYEDF